VPERADRLRVTFLAIASSSIHWLARPHLFTILFLVIFYWLLERCGTATCAAVAIAALTVLWTNLHGGFFVGIALTGAYAAGELASWALDSRPKSAGPHCNAASPTCWPPRDVSRPA